MSNSEKREQETTTPSKESIPRVEGLGVRRVNPHTKEAEWLLVSGKDMGRWVVCFTQGCVAVDVLNKEYACSIVDLSDKTDHQLELVEIGLDIQTASPIVKQGLSPKEQWFLKDSDFRMTSLYGGTEYTQEFLIEMLLKANTEILRLWAVERYLRTD